MNPIPVFVLLCEILPFEGSLLDPTDVAGAFVRCYVQARSRSAAIKAVEQALHADRLQLVELEWCENEAACEWENPDDETASELIQEARDTGQVIYDEFHTWGHDALDG